VLALATVLLSRPLEIHTPLPAPSV
jgi:hypothetical protein